VMSGGRIVQADSPVEVYRNPAARFVGSFIGNPPMNFLPATSVGSGQWQVAGMTFAGPAAAGGVIEFAIRPEDLAVAPGGFAAVTRVVEPLGAHTLVTAEVGGKPFRAVLDSDIAVRPGDALSLLPKPDRIRWFDPDTTLAIPGNSQ
jgi:multiple sugar transport system ATP-binding protein